MQTFRVMDSSRWILAQNPKFSNSETGKPGINIIRENPVTRIQQLRFQKPMNHWPEMDGQRSLHAHQNHRCHDQHCQVVAGVDRKQFPGFSFPGNGPQIHWNVKAEPCEDGRTQYI